MPRRKWTGVWCPCFKLEIQQTKNYNHTILVLHTRLDSATSTSINFKSVFDAINDFNDNITIFVFADFKKPLLDAKSEFINYKGRNSNPITIIPFDNGTGSQGVMIRHALPRESYRLD